MTYDTSYSFTGTDVPDDTYERQEEDYVENSPTIKEVARIRLKKLPVKTGQKERDQRLNWLRNLREE